MLISVKEKVSVMTEIPKRVYLLYFIDIFNLVK